MLSAKQTRRRFGVFSAKASQIMGPGARGKRCFRIEFAATGLLLDTVTSVARAERQYAKSKGDDSSASRCPVVAALAAASARARFFAKRARTQ